MGRIRTGEIKKASFKLIKGYPDSFGTDFKKNKDELNKMDIISEKRLKNRIAGYITREMVIKNRKPKE